MTTADLLIQKLNTFLKDPWVSTQDRLERNIRIIMKSYARHKLAQNRALDIIREFASKRPAGAAPPNFHELWFLYHVVRERKPKVILEFGSGYSTVILAKALLDNGAGHLYTVDSDHYRTESTAKRLPHSVRRFCDVSYSALQEISSRGTLGYRHEKIPNIIPNFCHVDGPPTTKERKVAVDLLEMEDRFPPDFFLVIDGRETHAQFLRENFRRNYSVRQRKFFAKSMFALRTN
jgi:hypothetical protein